MMVSGAQADFDFEDRADAVRRALGGLAGTKKSTFGFGNASHKPVMSIQPSATPASQPLQTPVPRIPLQSTATPTIGQSMPNTGLTSQAPANKEATNKGMKPMQLGTAAAQPGGTTTVKDAQELLCQLRQTEKQPIRGLESVDTAVPEVMVATQPIQGQSQVRRGGHRDSVFRRDGKKKSEIEKENDRLLDELEALGEPAEETPGETPVDQNQRLRRQATAAMLKHSFFPKKKVTPPASTASGDFSNRTQP